MGHFIDRDNLRAAAAELIATFMFVFVGIGAVGTLGRLGVIGASDVLFIGLAHGLSFAIALIAVSRISGGHINPAITIAMLITGNIGLARAIMYIIVQVSGAVLAMIAIDGLAFETSNLGLQSITSSTGVANGFVLMVILSFFLVFTFFATAVDKRGNTLLAPLAIGTVIALSYFVTLSLTGGAINPVRAFAPALVHGTWDDHWVYWAGPVVGALVAGVVYATVFGTAEDRQRAGVISLGEAKSAPEPRRRS